MHRKKIQMLAVGLTVTTLAAQAGIAAPAFAANTIPDSTLLSKMQAMDADENSGWETKEIDTTQDNWEDSFATTIKDLTANTKTIFVLKGADSSDTVSVKKALLVQNGKNNVQIKIQSESGKTIHLKADSDDISNDSTRSSSLLYIKVTRTTSSVSIQNMILDGNGKGRVLYVDKGSVSLENTTVENGTGEFNANTSDNRGGAAIYIGGNVEQPRDGINPKCSVTLGKGTVVKNNSYTATNVISVSADIWCNHNNSEIIMEEGSEVSNNEITINDGIVHGVAIGTQFGKITINGGSIKNNSCISNDNGDGQLLGVAISKYESGAVLKINGGTISENTAKGVFRLINGIGIYARGENNYFYGGTVEKNTCSECSTKKEENYFPAGVYANVAKDYPGHLGGGFIVKDNEWANIYLAVKNPAFILDKALTDDAYMDFKYAYENSVSVDNPVTLIQPSSDVNLTEEDLKHFFYNGNSNSDKENISGDYTAAFKDNTIQIAQVEMPGGEVTVSDEQGLKTALKMASTDKQDKTVITLNNDIRISSNASIAKGRYVTIKSADGKSYAITAADDFSSTKLMDVYGSLDLENVTLDGNKKGNVLYAETGSDINVGNDAKITGGLLGVNTDVRFGGGLHIAYGANATLDGGTISGNEAVNGKSYQFSASGIGVYDAGTFIMKAGSIDNNTISKDSESDANAVHGGGITVTETGKANIEGGSISENTVTGNGGGINSSGEIVLSNVSVSKNSAANKNEAGNYYQTNGGGIYASSGTVTLNGNASISENSATNGGGIYLTKETDSHSQLIMNEGSAVEDNSTFLATNGGNTSYGAGVFIDSAEMTMNGGTISGNKMEKKEGIDTKWYKCVGGGIYLNGDRTDVSTGMVTESNVIPATLNLYGGTITGNSAVNGGSGIYVSNVSVTYSSMSKKSTTYGQGASVLNIKGNPKVQENTDDDILIAPARQVISTKSIAPQTITLTGALDNDAVLNISKQIETYMDDTASEVEDNVIATSGDSYSITDQDVALLNIKLSGTLAKKTLSAGEVVAEALQVDALEDQIYTGEAITPAINVKDGDESLTAGSDFDVDYENNTAVGTAYATIKGVGNTYSGSVKKEFKIVPSEEAQEVINLIDALGDDTANLDSTKVNEAYAKYNALNATQKASIDSAKRTKIEFYKELVDAADPDKNAVEYAIKQIESLKDTASLTVSDDKQAVKNARTIYDSLTSGQKEKVPAADKEKLTEAEEQISKLEAAPVVELINKIPEASAITSSNRAETQSAVNSARAAYDKLDADAQKQVSNYSSLTEAEKKLASGVVGYDSTTAEGVTIMINRLPANVTSTDEASVKQARTAYDNLSDTEKDKVSRSIYQKLLDAEAALSGSSSEANAVATLINNIPSTVTASNKNTVTAARSAYDALSSTDKNKIDAATLKKLTDAEGQIATLEATPIITQITNIGSVTQANYKTKTTAVTAARTAYDKLDSNAKAKVTNYSLLQADEQLIAGFTAADTTTAEGVAALIDALPSSVTLTNETAVTTARTAYDKLSNSEKSKMYASYSTQLTKLSTAETRITTLKNQQAASTVQTQLNNLPAASSITLSDESKVTAARTAYDALTADQKKLVSSTATKKLTDAEAKITSLKSAQSSTSAADKVTDQIQALRPVSSLTLSDKSKVTAARTAYNSLTSTQKAQITDATLTILKNAEDQISSLESGQTTTATAETVTGQIADLRPVSDLTLSDKSKVEAARTAYNSLSPSQKVQVSDATLKILKEAEDQIDSLENRSTTNGTADSVILAIAKLPAVTDLKTSDEDAVKAARSAYDALSDTEKAKVTNINTLTAAESQISTLKENSSSGTDNEILSRLTALTVENQILALPSVETMTLSDQTTVEAARAAYDGLTSSQKKYVSSVTLTKLTNAEAQITVLEQAKKNDQIRPAKVTGVKASSSTYNAVKLTWADAKGAIGYQVYQLQNDGTYKKVATTMDTTATIKGLKTGTKYYFKVCGITAQDGATLYGNFSAVVSATPKLGKVKSVTVKAGKNKAKVSWSKVSGASGYRILRATGSGSYKTVKTVKGGSTLSFTNKRLKKGTRYYYKVKAYRNVSGKKVFGKVSAGKSAVVK